MKKFSLFYRCEFPYLWCYLLTCTNQNSLISWIKYDDCVSCPSMPGCSQSKISYHEAEAGEHNGFKHKVIFAGAIIHLILVICDYKKDDLYSCRILLGKRTKQLASWSLTMEMSAFTNHIFTGVKNCLCKNTAKSPDCFLMHFNTWKGSNI